MSGPVVGLRHVLGIRDLSAEQVGALLDRAAALRERVRERGPLALMPGRRVALLFLEPSTRTRFSFEMATRNLGAVPVAFAASASSTKKGETLLDTARTLRAVGVDAFVVRDGRAGAPHRLAHALGAPVLNAGDGVDEHPTQALLDALTLRDHLGELEGRRVVIVGDVRHSRVARSNAFLLSKLGAHVVFCGPRPLCPPESVALGVREVRHDLDEVLPGADAVMMLRIQKERLSPGLLHSDGEYRRFFGLDEARARRLPDHAVVLHPAPMNRGVEIADAVADGPRSLVFEQIENGVYVRMACLEAVLEGA